MENETAAAEETYTPPPMIRQGIEVIGPPAARAKLWEAMGKARASFEKVTKSIKGQTGNQTFMYSNFAQISAAMVEPLAENGLSIIQMITTPSPDVGCVTTLLAGHGAELWVEIKFPTSDNEHGFQATIKDFGAATTYYKRYSVQAIGFIEGDRDAENAPDMRGPGRVTGQLKGGVPDPQLGEIRRMAADMNLSKAEGEKIMKAAIGSVKQLDALTKEEGARFIAALADEQRTRGAA